MAELHIMAKPTGISNIVTALFAALACTSFVFCTFGTNWVHTTKIQQNTQFKYEQQGLWKKCVGAPETQNQQSQANRCQKQYPSIPLNKKPTWLVINQFLMPMACGFMFFAVFSSALGHPMLSKFNISPALMMGFTSVLILVSGIIALVGTSFCVNAAVTSQFGSFYNPWL